MILVLYSLMCSRFFLLRTVKITPSSQGGAAEGSLDWQTSITDYKPCVPVCVSFEDKTVDPISGPFGRIVRSNLTQEPETAVSCAI